MNKDTKLLEDSKKNCCDTTFDELYSKVYQKLNTFGDKSQLHYKIAEGTLPVSNVNTIRSYCSKPSRIPVNKRQFYFRLLSEVTYHYVSEKVSKQMTFFEQIQKELDQLKNYIG